MCQEIHTRDGKRLTTPKELAIYLVTECLLERFSTFTVSDLKELEFRNINWYDCCLCGVNIESICRDAGKDVEWDIGDPMVLLIK